MLEWRSLTLIDSLLLTNISIELLVWKPPLRCELWTEKMMEKSKTKNSWNSSKISANLDQIHSQLSSHVKTIPSSLFQRQSNFHLSIFFFDPKDRELSLQDPPMRMHQVEKPCQIFFCGYPYTKFCPRQDIHFSCRALPHHFMGRY